MKHCGRAACKADLSGMRPNAKWCSQKCAMRVRRGEKALQTRTGGPSGAQIAYGKAVRAATAALVAAGLPPHVAEDRAVEAMFGALSRRQREMLARREMARFNG